MRTLGSRARRPPRRRWSSTTVSGTPGGGARCGRGRRDADREVVLDRVVRAPLEPAGDDRGEDDDVALAGQVVGVRADAPVAQPQVPCPLAEPAQRQPRVEAVVVQAGGGRDHPRAPPPPGPPPPGPPPP